MRLATWNVNSIRQRIDGLQRFVAQASPDVICLQETKVRNEEFPLDAIAALDYPYVEINGQKGYNGVAVLSRLPFSSAFSRSWCGKQDCRHIGVHLSNGIELHNLYVPSGGSTPDPESNDKFAHKLAFLREMAEWANDEKLSDRRVVVVGDLNVAPLETDVWNHKRLVRSVGHTPQESELLLNALKAGNFVDVPRHFVPEDEPLYTWWGYRFAASFEKNYGWRLDHAWITPPLVAELARMRVVKETRTWDKPSDHVPVVLDLV